MSDTVGAWRGAQFSKQRVSASARGWRRLLPAWFRRARKTPRLQAKTSGVPNIGRRAMCGSSLAQTRRCAKSR